MLKNLMEDVVNDALPSVLKESPKICTCEKCIMDIKALALNNLCPRYTVTENGQVYAKVLYELDLQYKSDVIRELLKAIEIIAHNPQH